MTTTLLRNYSCYYRIIVFANIISGTTAIVLGSIAAILFITVSSAFAQCIHYLVIVAVATIKVKRNLNL
jgi:hypothetical protein